MALTLASLTIALALLMPSEVLAQHQTFRDANGREVGRSVTDTKGNTVFYDAAGRVTSRSFTDGNTIIIEDAAGRRIGTATKGR